MTRAIIELLFTIILLVVARSILTSLFSGVKNSIRQPDAAPTGQPKPSSLSGSELHKDPVCGTYVPESTQFQRRIGTRTEYYCSDDCKQKHARVTG